MRARLFDEECCSGLFAAGGANAPYHTRKIVAGAGKDRCATTQKGADNLIADRGSIRRSSAGALLGRGDGVRAVLPRKISRRRAAAVAQSVGGSLTQAAKDNNKNWDKSPFGWLRSLSPRARGLIFEEIVGKTLKDLGFSVDPRTGVENDLVVNGVKAEIKMSFLWSRNNKKSKPHFVWSQIRNQDYQVLLLFGIAPDNVYLWSVPKKVALEHALPQHGGSGSKETWWIYEVYPDNIPDWLRPWGGVLDDGIARLRELTAKGGS